MKQFVHLIATLTVLIYFLQCLNSAIIYDRDFSYNFFGFKVMFSIK